MELFTQNIPTIHFNVKRQYVVALWGGIRLETLKVLFLLLSFTSGGNVWGKMIEFLWEVEPPASPRSWGVPVKQNQVWQKTPLGLGERERARPPWEYFKYSGEGVVLLFRANSPSGCGCLQTPQVGLESKSFYAGCQIKLSSILKNTPNLGDGEGMSAYNLRVE